MKYVFPLLALSVLTACHRFAPAPFGGIGTEVLVSQSALEKCTTVAWTMRVLDAKTNEDISASLKYRLLLDGKVKEAERAFGPVALDSVSPFFQLVSSQLPPNDGLTVNEFTCTKTGETLKLPAQARQLNGLKVNISYDSTFQAK
ncbi:hypothetical protein [Deinococcus aquaedulcis]|uniref:hypothetical protein n=1 Tax=Deinococcus aquaedulcis TaxID=2840455 RepID=UPI001C83006C|nr:hypothetical protein [Deinococcus aquaedulcis]